MPNTSKCSSSAEWDTGPRPQGTPTPNPSPAPSCSPAQGRSDSSQSHQSLLPHQCQLAKHISPSRHVSDSQPIMYRHTLRCVPYIGSERQRTPLHARKEGWASIALDDVASNVPCLPDPTAACVPSARRFSSRTPPPSHHRPGADTRSLHSST